MNGIWNFNKRRNNKDRQAISCTFRALNCKAAQAHRDKWSSFSGGKKYA